MEINYKKSKSIIYSCRYDIVFCSKYRRRVLEGEVKKRLEELITATCAKLQVEILRLEIAAEHVSLSLDVDPQIGVHKVIKAIKRDSSNVLRREFSSLKSRIPTLWTNSYLCISVGDASKEAMAQYIKAQKISQRAEERARKKEMEGEDK